MLEPAGFAGSNAARRSRRRGLLGWPENGRAFLLQPTKRWSHLLRRLMLRTFALGRETPGLLTLETSVFLVFCVALRRNSDRFRALAWVGKSTEVGPIGVNQAGRQEHLNDTSLPDPNENLGMN